MAKNQNNNVAPATQKTEPEAKKDALATALAQIEKQFGKGAVMKLGDNASMQVDAISTGSLGLDLALGVGGVPRGRIIEVYGPESSGKTTLALHILAEAQKKGGEVAFIDVEHALDPTYAEALGVDINNLLVSQPDTGEQAMEICEALVRSGAIDAIVVDSVAAIKKVVYVDKEATLSEVADACKKNFVGYEALRAKLLAAPKYGNDDDFADEIAADLWEWFAHCTMRLKMYRGHYCDAAVQMVQSNVGYGAMTGATPNGRLAGMPISDTMSATQQADTNGPTAAARSYGKLDFPAYTNGTLLNMWISQSELMQ